jgi:DNA topoisomerase-6 subunit A
VFQQLHRYGFWKKNKAILVTSAGQPDRATRRFVRRLSEEYNLPVYILADSDPYGFYIYSVFKAGSITLSYESERLATPTAKFIGVMMTDIFGDAIFRKIIKDREARKTLEEITPGITDLKPKTPYLSESERSNFIIKAKTRDLERAVELIGYRVAEVCIEEKDAKNKIKKKEGLTGYPWFTTPQWVRELCIFFNTLSKLEIEAMASKGLKFLADKYIPEKISIGDWID